jgi:hypothetical protein
MLTPKKNPTAPFEISLNDGWAIPYDTYWRPNEVPNTLSANIASYASIGHYVMRNANKYCPAFNVVETINLLSVRGEELAVWKKLHSEHTLVLNKLTSELSALQSAYSSFESAVAWFFRQLDRTENQILCFDRTAEIKWTIEPGRPELWVYLDADGKEVAETDITTMSNSKHYLIHQHPNAVAQYGE